MEDNKQYTWTPESEFKLSGKEFGVLYNTLAAIVNTSGFQQELIKAQQTMAISQLQQVMNQILGTNIEAGIAVEAAAPEQSSSIEPPVIFPAAEEPVKESEVHTMD